MKVPSYEPNGITSTTSTTVPFMSEPMSLEISQAVSNLQNSVDNHTRAVQELQGRLEEVCHYDNEGAVEPAVAKLPKCALAYTIDMIQESIELSNDKILAILGALEI